MEAKLVPRRNNNFSTHMGTRTTRLKSIPDLLKTQVEEAVGLNKQEAVGAISVAQMSQSVSFKYHFSMAVAVFNYQLKTTEDIS